MLANSASVAAATMAYSTFFGAGQYEGAYAVTVDPAGNAYIAGGTTSTNRFPLFNPLQLSYGGGYGDGFIAKFDPAGTLLFSTYFGGAGADAVNAIALDPDGNIVISGETHSVDLPTTDNAFQPDYGGGSAFGYGDGFIAKMTPDGSQLLYCSYFGGSGDEKINGMAMDSAGNLCVTGQTDSKNLPLKIPLQSKFAGGDTDGFVARFDATLTNLVFSTYFGGGNNEEDQKIAVDPGGLIYVSGRTLSADFPVTAGAFQTKHIQNPDHSNHWDAVIAKLKSDGSGLIYSSYVGDGSDDAAYAIAADENGSAYITGGISTSWDDGTFPLGFQREPGYGGVDAWVAKLNPEGSRFEWFSYLGGSGEDYGFGLVLDKANNVYVTGITTSFDFPVRDAVQTKYGGGDQDAFASKISADGKQLIYSTYLGGSREEWGYDLAVDYEGNLIGVGQSASLNFPTRNAIQATNATLRTISNPSDATITKMSPNVQPPVLTVRRSGQNVLISWPVTAADFVLESTSVLVPGATWQPVPTSPTVLGNQFIVVQRASEFVQLHRLRRP